VLVAPLGGIGKDYPLSREKLTSVLGFATARDAQAGLELCVQILRFGGDGHSAVIHSRDVAQTEYMAAQLPAFRVIVNSMSTLGSIGYTCRFTPSLTLGTGGMGGAIVGDNITVTHLINRKRVAWEVESPPASVKRAEAAATRREPSIDEIVAQVLARLGRASVEA
jgi:acetaldehyde dehydrogenase (acetylating)